jgi:hypothetical protein
VRDGLDRAGVRSGWSARSRCGERRRDRRSRERLRGASRSGVHDRLGSDRQRRADGDRSGRRPPVLPVLQRLHRSDGVLHPEDAGGAHRPLRDARGPEEQRRVRWPGRAAHRRGVRQRHAARLARGRRGERAHRPVHGPRHVGYPRHRLSRRQGVWPVPVQRRLLAMLGPRGHDVGAQCGTGQRWSRTLCAVCRLCVLLPAGSLLARQGRGRCRWHLYQRVRSQAGQLRPLDADRLAGRLQAHVQRPPGRHQPELQRRLRAGLLRQPRPGR